MPFKIVRNDITKVTADAIVNTANPKPTYGSGTDLAIYQAAGADQLLAERKKIGSIRTGDVAVTSAFALPARYIIHTVGPSWWDGKHGEYQDLASCYRKSLSIARQLSCRSIAFPLISTGVYGFPKEKALQIALEEIERFLKHHEMDVTLVVFDKKAFDLSSDLIADVCQYIDDHYVEVRWEEEYPRSALAQSRRRLEDTGRVPSFDAGESSAFEDFYAQMGAPMSAPRMEPDEDEDYAEPAGNPAKFLGKLSKTVFHSSLSDVMKHLGETFQERLFRLIDERELKDSEVYKKANIDRKLFSKIRCNADYIPKKRTAIALAIALELNLDETQDLLRCAGLTLSASSKFDLIIEYCIENQIYNIYEINALLFEYDQPMLGY